MPKTGNIVNVSSYNKQLSISSMTNSRCDHRMNLPSDAITVLMVITGVLIYVISYFIHTYNPVHVSFA